jgi:hypothetical protein
MKKPASLRAALARLMPDLARDTDRLAMWVEKGKVVAPRPQRGFAEYDQIVLVSRYAGDPAALFFVICDWLRSQQPDLLASGADGFPFEVDMLSKRNATSRSPSRCARPSPPRPARTANGTSTWCPNRSMMPESQWLGPRLTSIWADGIQIAPLPPSGPDPWPTPVSTLAPLARRLSATPRPQRTAQAHPPPRQGPARRQRPPHPRQRRTRRHPDATAQSKRDRRGRLRKRKGRMFPKAASPATCAGSPQEVVVILPPTDRRTAAVHQFGLRPRRSPHPQLDQGAISREAAARPAPDDIAMIEEDTLGLLG